MSGDPDDKGCDKIEIVQAFKRSKIFQRTTNPTWNQKFDFDEIGDGEYLKIRCYSEDTFSDDNIGSARVNLEGLVEGSIKDVWIPLEKVKSGELRFQIEAVKMDDNEGSITLRRLAQNREATRKSRLRKKVSYDLTAALLLLYCC
ncbi:hypothetical protein POM88_001869 [Heracleum sosnowskyi]|uniref:C2 domain-containing protein n=1 Tax=Heracleum sosnowskyi TaxID=360622 RepID=A0AAD8JDS8_9APIA|nr:hypothetical protein POM88_001869 [Heracleum sosnowskyi]